MPRRGILPGLADWLRFGFGVADQAQVSTPSLEDTMKLVVPWDPLRAGIWCTQAWGSAASGAGLEPLLVVVGGNSGTYILGCQANTTGAAQDHVWGFERDRAAVIARFPTFVSLQRKAWRSAGPAERGQPSTIWEEATIPTAERPVENDAGTNLIIVGGGLDNYPRLTSGAPIFLPPGNVFWMERPVANSVMFIGFMFLEP